MICGLFANIQEILQAFRFRYLFSFCRGLYPAILRRLLRNLEDKTFYHVDFQKKSPARAFFAKFGAMKRNSDVMESTVIKRPVCKIYNFETFGIFAEI